MAKVYVASQWEAREAAAALMTRLKERGHVITLDWTKVTQESQAQAIADREGVLAADAFVFLTGDKYEGMGALVEFGIAVARNIPIFVLGLGAERNIFRLLPTVRTIPDSNEDVLFAELSLPLQSFQLGLQPSVKPVIPPEVPKRPQASYFK